MHAFLPRPWGGGATAHDQHGQPAADLDVSPMRKKGHAAALDLPSYTLKTRCTVLAAHDASFNEHKVWVMLQHGEADGKSRHGISIKDDK